MTPPVVLAPEMVIHPRGNTSSNHIHRKLPIDLIRAGQTVTLHRESYEGAHLAKQVRNLCTLRPPNLTPLQRQALEAYRSSTDYKIDSFSNVDNHTVEKLRPLALYAHLFDALFFANSLLHSGRLSVHISDRSPDTAGLYGFLHDHPTKPGEKQIILYLDDQSQDTPLQRMNRMLGTLAHEMTHALILMYCCVECQKDMSFEVMGPKWHGIVWLDIASQVQAAIRSRRMLGLPDVELGVAKEVASESHKANLPVPRDRDLQAWGVSRTEVKRRYQEYVAAKPKKVGVRGRATKAMECVDRGSTYCVTIFKPWT
ncbi:hypothetical protein HYALB_00012808 [Hymenoscyphus albidus]|uniref:SprT-like domain-containing protein n=1 Tax=Hymenoscyphus albidus TaxID=595503 RepID=A0A9N9LUT1_9HELO|nr:hypothetical protein HYALB_00012808 [Hymenoscyphus albidus]